MLRLDLIMFGGRGAVSGMPKNKKKAIASYKKNIKEHQDKIRKALNGEKGYNKITIPHWESEIKIFQDNIDKIERRYRK